MRRLLYGLLVVFIVLATLLTLLFGTEPGSRWLVQRGAALAPGELHFEGLRGSFLQGLEFEGLRYEQAGLSAGVQRLELRVNALALFAGRLAISRLHADDIDIVTAAGDEAPVTDTPFAPPAAIALPLRLSLSDVVLRRLAFSPGGGDPVRVEAVRLEAVLGEVLRIRQLDVALEGLALGLAGQAGLAMPYPVALTLDWRWQAPAAVAEGLQAQRLTGRLDLAGDLDRLAFRHALTGPLRASAEGELRDPLTAAPAWRVAADWEAFAWRLAGGEALAVEAGDLQAEGGMADYRFSLATALTPPGFPRQGLTLAGQGNRQGIDDLRLEATGDTGRLLVAGSLDWQEMPAWDLAITGEALAPGALDPRLDGRLDLQARSDGRLDPATGPTVRLELERLDGRLRDYPVSARGSVRLEGQRLVTPGVQLRVGRNRLELSGEADRGAPDLRLAVNAPQLAALWPGLQGRLVGSLRLDDSWRAPRVDLQLTGQAMGYADWALASLAVQARGSLQGEGRLTLDAGLGELARDGETLVTRAALQGQGQRAAHRLTLDADTREGHLGLALDGGFVDAGADGGGGEGMRGLGWRGQITRLDLAGTRLGDWRLDAPAGLGADGDSASLSLLCLTQAAARLCLEGGRDPQGGPRAVADLTEFPLARLDPWLPENARLEGTLAANLRLRDAAGLEVLGEARSTRAALVVEGMDGEAERIRVRAASLEAAWRDQALEATGSLSFAAGGQAGARLQATPEGDSYRLAGQLQARLAELRWLEMLAPALREVGGRLEADLALGGTLAAPDFSGTLQLDEGRAQIPAAGIVIEDGRLQARARGLDRLTLEGEAQSGEGRLQLGGELGLRPEGLPWARLTLSGERFLAVRRPEAEVQVSPDLGLMLEGRRVEIDGSLTIPTARIELRELPPSAVSVSRDQVIVDAPPTEASPWEVLARVRLVLGEQVRLSGFGLSARLAGEVEVAERPQQPVRAEGEIRIEEGRYKAYGQDLSVERGVLVFQGPADNPGLDIRAVRRVPEYAVTAGIAIGGTLQEPRSRLFSEPAMEDSETMAYLLTGRPLSGASEADAGVLMTAIAAFGVEQGGVAARQIGEAVGLDEVAIESEGAFEQSALMLGKHLSSRLYLRYTVGLFEQASTLMLRYKLTRRLNLETQTSGEAQSMDLIYRLER